MAVLACLLAAAAALPQGESREVELERLRGEIARLQARLGDVQQRERTAAGELEQTQLQLTLQETRLAEAQAAQGVASERIATLEREVGVLQARLDRVRADLRGRLSSLYRLGRAGYLRLLLALAPGQEVLPAIRQLRYLARRDGSALERFLDARSRLAAEQTELLEARGGLATWVEQERLRREKLEVVRRDQAALLARVERERRTLETRSGALAEQAQKLSNFVAFLSGRNTAPAGTPIQGFKGVLDWPAAGRVAIPFGPRLDPRYRTRVPHNGVAIATTAGAEVRSVFPGTVVFAAPFQGYGQTVIVHHPGRVFTLYAGLGQVRAAQRDVLSLGQVVGVAGDQLYFEIRVDNRPENPISWLREVR
jgi:septal ring factor EnvC (AmiA/AmiB activator)